MSGSPKSFTPSDAESRDRWFETSIRVRFPETDSQGVVHHSVYLHYFEIGRTELLRSAGVAYSELEKDGVVLIITDVAAKFVAPARYDDVLIVRTAVDRVTRARIVLRYEIVNEATSVLVCHGSTTLASLSPDGRPSPLPERLASVLEDFSSAPDS
jgi:acyl-CoA thioester hydrolase